MRGLINGEVIYVVDMVVYFDLVVEVVEVWFIIKDYNVLLIKR